MRLLVGDKEVFFSEEDLESRYLNEGAEGIVYTLDSDAVKIYKPICFRSRPMEDECLKLSGIKTSRILMPEKMVYALDSGTKVFKGYTTPFIYQHPATRVLDMKVSSFVDELDIIYEDLKVLASNGVEIDDWHNDNILFDGTRIFVGDPGGIIFRRDIRELWSLSNNTFTFNRFLLDEVFHMARLSKRGYTRLNEKFDDVSYMGDQIRDTCGEKETVKQYIKRMAR